MSKRKMVHRVVILLICIALLTVSLVACDIKDSATIKFYLGNELYYSSPVVDGEFAMPKPPKLDGYTFVGWYLDKQFNMAYNLTFAADGKLTDGASLYAKFLLGEVEDCLIILQPNNGSDTIKFNLTIDNFIFPTLNRAGYSFGGWYSDIDLITPWSSFDTLSNEDILYAKWSYILPSVLINYYANGGSEVISQYVDVGGTIKQPSCTRENYNLVGWYADKACTIPWVFNTDTVQASTTLYAKWVQKNHIVTVYGRGNMVLDKYAVEYGGNIKQLHAPSESGNFTFIGWFADATGQLPLDINQPITKDINIWSKWRENKEQVSVNYIVDGDSIAVLSNDKDTKIATPYSAKSIDNQSFFGWYSNSEMTKLWDFKEQVTTQSITLYGRYLTPTNDLKFSLSHNDTYTVVGYNAAALGDVIVLPEQYNNKAVAAIGNQAFANTTAKKLLISRNIHTIGDKAFDSASNISTIYIPSTVKYISSTAFNNLNSLAVINLDTRCNDYAMYENALYSSDYAQLLVYEAKSRRQVVNIHESTLFISDYAFAQSDNLKRVYFNNRLHSIGDAAFFGCDILETLQFPVKLNDIGALAFKDCTALKTVTLPAVLGDIGQEAFAGCDNVMQLTLPKSCNNIGERAFKGMKRLSTLNISSSIGSIGKSAFDDINATVYIDCPILPNSWARDWSNSNNVIFAQGYISNCGLWQYTLNGDYATISAYVGKETSVTIPYEIDGYLVVAMGAIFAGNINVNRVVIEAELTEIIANTFNGASKLGSIVLPNTLEYIGARAFYKCSSLASLSLPAGIKEVGDSAFSNCSSLQQVDLPAAMTDIATKAFANCTMLANIKLNDALKYIGESAFSNCVSLLTVTWNKNLLAIGDGAFDNCNRLKTLILPDNIKSLGAKAFNDCASLTSVYLPKQLTAIGISAFKGCSAITRVTFATDSILATISNSAFAGCIALTKINLPDNLKIIDDYAFFGAINLLDISFGSKLTKIGAFAFKDCNIASIDLPNTVLYLGEDAFTNCPMQYAVIGADIAKFSTAVFRGVSGMTIFIKGTLVNYWDSEWANGNIVVLDGQWAYVDGVPNILQSN